MDSYSSRLAESIDVDEDFILIGLSFGGIVAIEIAKIFPPVKLFLISSVSVKSSIPLIYRIMGAIKLDKLLPRTLMLAIRTPLHLFFGPLSPCTKSLLDFYINSCDKVLVKWALGEISRWKNTTIPKNLVHIHGYRDRVFPASFVKADYFITDGGHLCVYDQSAAVNSLLMKEITC